MRYFQLPDGRTLELPDTLTPEQEQTLTQKLADRYPELGEKIYGPQRTAGGHAKELLKGIPRGFVGTLGTAAQGIAGLIPDVIDQGIETDIGKLNRQWETEGPLAPERAYRDSYSTQFGSGLGSLGAFLVPGTAITKMAPAVSTFKALAPLAGALGAGEAQTRIEQAREEGLDVTGGQEAGATLAGSAIGLTELIPAERLFKLFRGLPKNHPLTKRALDGFKSALAQGSAEGAQEVFASVAQNALANGIYDAERPVWDSAIDDFTVGAGVGAFADVVMRHIGRRSGVESIYESERKARERRIERQREAIEASRKSEADRIALEEMAADAQASGEAPIDLGTGLPATIPGEGPRILQQRGIQPGATYGVRETPQGFVVFNENTGIDLDGPFPEREQAWSVAAKSNQRSVMKARGIAVKTALNGVGVPENSTAATIAEDMMDPETTIIPVQTLSNFDSRLNEERSKKPNLNPTDTGAAAAFKRYLAKLKAKGQALKSGFSFEEAQRILKPEDFEALVKEYARVSNDFNMQEWRRLQTSPHAPRPIPLVAQYLQFPKLNKLGKPNVVLKAIQDVFEAKNIEFDPESPGFKALALKLTGQAELSRMTIGQRMLLMTRVNGMPRFDSKTRLPDLRARDYSKAQFDAAIELAVKNGSLTPKDLKKLGLKGKAIEQVFNDLVESGRGVRDGSEVVLFKHDPNIKNEADFQKAALARSQPYMVEENTGEFARRLQNQGYDIGTVQEAATRELQQAQEAEPKPTPEAAASTERAGPEIPVDVAEYRKQLRQQVVDELRARLDAYGLRDVGLVVEKMPYTSLARFNDILTRVELNRGARGEPMGERLNHEVIHAMRELDLLTEDEYRSLVGAAERIVVPKEIDEKANKLGLTYAQRAKAIYQRKGETLQTDEVAMEEAVAEMHRAWSRLGKGFAGKPRGILQRIENTLTSFYEAVGAFGYVNPEELFADIETGKVGRRERGMSLINPTGPIRSARALFEEQNDQYAMLQKMAGAAGTTGREMRDGETAAELDTGRGAIPAPQAGATAEEARWLSSRAVPQARAHASEYMKSEGRAYTQRPGEWVPVDPAYAARIAQAFDAMKHEPNNLRVRAAYTALAAETKKQFLFLQRKGVKFEPWRGEGQPYADSSAMLDDIRNNDHLWFFPTDVGFGMTDADRAHPLLKFSGISLNGEKMVYNDLFRAVHDYFGHGQEGYTFGPRGEENAWRSHRRMYSDLAAKALTSETRGQNSWVNFGPHGEANRANPENTIYSEQKVGIMPDEFISLKEMRKSIDEPMPEDHIYNEPFGDMTNDLMDAAGYVSVKGKPVGDDMYFIENPKKGNVKGARGLLVKMVLDAPVGQTIIWKDYSLSTMVHPQFRRMGHATSMYNKLVELGFPVDQMTGRGRVFPAGRALSNAWLYKYLSEKFPEGQKVVVTNKAGETVREYYLPWVDPKQPSSGKEMRYIEPDKVEVTDHTADYEGAMKVIRMRFEFSLPNVERHLFDIYKMDNEQKKTYENHLKRIKNTKIGKMFRVMATYRERNDEIEIDSAFPAHWTTFDKFDLGTGTTRNIIATVLSHFTPAAKYIRYERVTGVHDLAGTMRFKIPSRLVQFKPSIRDQLTLPLENNPWFKEMRDPRQDGILTAVSELGGVSEEEAAKYGIDPADIRGGRAARGTGPKGGVRAKVFTKGGRSFDHMAEVLAERGFPVFDEKGNYDPHVLAERIDDELRGKAVHSAIGDEGAYENRLMGWMDMQQALDEEADRQIAEANEELVVAAQKERPERDPVFQEWFGDSVVKDSKGRPKKVYMTTAKEMRSPNGLPLDELKTAISDIFGPKRVYRSTVRQTELVPDLDTAGHDRYNAAMNEYIAWAKKYIDNDLRRRGNKGTITQDMRRAFVESSPELMKNMQTMVLATHDQPSNGKWWSDTPKTPHHLIKKPFGRWKHGAGLVAAYLKMENPLVIDAGGRWWGRVLLNSGTVRDSNFLKGVARTYDIKDIHLSTDSIVDFLETNDWFGHDGVWFKNINEGGPGANKSLGDVFVVKDRDSQVLNAFFPDPYQFKNMTGKEMRPALIDQLNYVRMNEVTKNPNTLVSTSPGMKRGYGIDLSYMKPEERLNTLARLHRDTMNSITDENGKLKFLNTLGVPHVIKTGLGHYEESNEFTFVLDLPESTMDEAEAIGKVMGDALMQDSLVVERIVKPDESEEGKTFGVVFTHPKGQFTLDELQALNTALVGYTLEPRGDTLVTLNFGDNTEAGAKQFYDKMMRLGRHFGLDTHGLFVEMRFPEHHDTIKAEGRDEGNSYKGGLGAVGSEDGPAGPSDIQRAALSSLYIPAYASYAHWVRSLGKEAKVTPPYLDQNSALLNSISPSEREALDAELSVATNIASTPRGNIPLLSGEVSPLIGFAAQHFAETGKMTEVSPQMRFKELRSVTVDDPMLGGILDDAVAHAPEQTLGESVLDALAEPKAAFDNFSRWFRYKMVNRYQAFAENEAALNPEGRARAETSAMAAALFADRARGILAAAMKMGKVIFTGSPLDGYTKVVDLVDPETGENIRGLLDVFAPLYGHPEGNLEEVFQKYAVIKRVKRLKQQAEEAKTQLSHIEATNRAIRSARKRVERIAESGRVVPADLARIASQQLVVVPDDLTLKIRKGTKVPGKLTDAELAKDAYIEQQYPQVATAWRRYQLWNDALIKFGVDTGVLNKETAAEWRENADYYPFYRELDGSIDGGRVFSGLVGATPFDEKLKGGESAVNLPPIEAITRNALAIIQAGMRNVAAQRVIRDAEALGQAEEVQRKSGHPDIVTIRVDGENKHYKVLDPLLLESMISFGDSSFGTIQRVLAAPAGLLRELVTRDPGFVMVNMLRDTLSAYVTTGSDFTPVLDTVKGFAAPLEQLESLGIVGGYDFSNDPQDIKKFLVNQIRKEGVDARSLSMNPVDMFSKLWDWTGQMTTRSDAATRQAVYNDVFAKTGSEVEAAFQALEVINFNRRGASTLMRTLTAAIPFLNARIQGLDVLYRSASGKYSSQPNVMPGDARARFLTRGAYLMALTGLYWLLVHDDDKYKNLRRELRDDNWIIPNPVDPKLPALKLPIPFEIGVLFKVVPEQMLNLAFGSEDQRDVVDSLNRQWTATLKMDPTAIQAFAPLLQAANNKNSYTRQDIVPYYMMKGLEPSEQYDPASTTEQARLLGEALNISPAKIDYVISGYGGTLGNYAMMVMDAGARVITGRDTAGTRFDPFMVQNQPILRRLFADTDYGRGLQQQFYELRGEVDILVGTMNRLKKQGRYDELAAYIRSRQDLISVRDSVRSLETYLSKWRARREQVLYSELPSASKRELLEQLEAERDRRLAVVPFLRAKSNLPLRLPERFVPLL